MKRPSSYVLLGGLVAGTFDITYACTFWYLFARRWSELAQRPWTFGPLYGVLLYFIMNYIVVPLSAV